MDTDDAVRNRHAGEPFSASDDEIAGALADVCVPALLCALVHMTGDPAWIRGDLRPHSTVAFDLSGGISSDDQSRARELALPVIAAYRDSGCRPVEVGRDVLVEMMAFLGCGPVDAGVADLFLHDLEFEGPGTDCVTWADEIPAEVKAASPVVVIGCGMAGIHAAIRLRHAGLPFTIVEKNAGPGGTWWENRYPGARVDVGSHSYSYSFENAYHWSEFYCQQPELRDYFDRVVDAYELRPHCRFGTAVTAAHWIDQTDRWIVHTRAADGAEERIEARFVISAVGSLNIPRMPDIEGMETFAGPSFHSARWPDGLDIAGTRFALIGAGASGFQIAPAVAETVEQLSIFQRTAQWVLPNPVYRAPVPAGERWALRHLPFYSRWVRFLRSYVGVAGGVEQYRIDPTYQSPDGLGVNPGHEQRKDALLAWMRSHLEDRPELFDTVVPDYPAMGKRILQDDGNWFATLKRPDVELVRDRIERIVPEGVVTADGTLREADVICYATGFRHNDFLASFEVTGRGGRSLREQWGEEPTAYLGITVPGFPNLFICYGPGTNLAHSAGLFFHADFQTAHAMAAIHEVLATGSRAIEVRDDAHDRYAERLVSEISTLVWAHPSIAHSHYKNPSGKVFTLSPWPLPDYWAMTRTLNPDDWIVT